MTHPLGSLHLFGLADRRLDAALTLGLLILVVASRLAAFPASVWELDEAIFAGAVVHFDPTDNLPHPPWFPLWIASGKLVHLFGIEAPMSLQLVSLFFSVWILFPLTALWSTVIPRSLAVGATVIFLITPGPWFFSGRAFCGTTATALLIAAFAFWLQAEERSRWLAAGSLLAALAVLSRPHFLPAVIGAMLIVGARASKNRLQMLTAFFVPVFLGGVVFIWMSGGLDPLWSALETHGEYHFSRLDEAAHGLAGSGLSRSLGHPAVTVGWLVLFHIGMIRLIRKGHWKELSPILLGALTPILLVVHLLSNPAHARYAVPILALMSGLVADGLFAVFRRWTFAAIGVTAVIASAFLVPQLVAYRSTVSPPVAAIDEAIIRAAHLDGVVVADRKLHAFFVLRRLTRPTPVPVLFDHMIELGHAPPPPPDRTVYVFDAVNPNLMETSSRQRTFTCSIPLVRALGQDRYLDLHVAAGARLRGHPDARGPLIFID